MSVIFFLAGHPQQLAGFGCVVDICGNPVECLGIRQGARSGGARRNEYHGELRSLFDYCPSRGLPIQGQDLPKRHARFAHLHSFPPGKPRRSGEKRSGLLDLEARGRRSDSGYAEQR